MGEAVQACPTCQGKLVPLEADGLAYPHYACLGCGAMYFTAVGRLYLCLTTKQSALDSLCRRQFWTLAPIAEPPAFPSRASRTTYRTRFARGVRKRGTVVR